MYELIILVKLICSHFLADFALQTDRIYKGKIQRNNRSVYYHILHSLIHAAVSYILVAEWNNWIIPITIFITHLIIDNVKYRCFKPNLRSFIFDQFAHILVILLLWFFIYGENINITDNLVSINSLPVWIVFTAYILMLKPSSVLLGMFLKQWTPESRESSSLPKAGQYIGYLERILILTFILINSIEGVGFLLAAKSVFRFGELNKAQEIRTTEYVLIGTMSSFALAVLTGIATRYIIGI